MSLIRDMTLVINAFFAWDFNSCELIHKDGVWHPIDFANPCPGLTGHVAALSLPWLILANLRWSIFAAVTKRQMRPMGWRRYFSSVEEGMTLRERLDALMPIVHRRFETERFEEFCEDHLAHLPEVARSFFTSADAKTRCAKGEATVPGKRVEEFTDLFFQRIPKLGRDRGRQRMKVKDSWHSERLGCEVNVARWAWSACRS